MTYQQILNDRAVGHAHQTALDRHPWSKGGVMDAVEDDKRKAKPRPVQDVR